jgi:hypothetical protein
MPKFIWIKTERYEVEADTLNDAVLTVRAFTIDGALADDVEYLDGTDEVKEMEE